MNVVSKATAGAVIAASAIIFTSSSVAAFTVEQTQELNTSVKTSINCTGNCSGSAEATQNGKQTQKIEMPTAAPRYATKRVAAPVYHYKNKKAKTVVWMPTTVVMMTDGQVRLNWGMRGGTCHVRYTEANSNVWKYNTSAGCDEAGITISGLQAGVSYKFQVRQDNSVWSRVMVGRAQ